MTDAREIIAQYLCERAGQGWSGISAFERAAYRTTAHGMIEAAAKAIATVCGEEWECCCSVKPGPDCDCGDALPEEGDGDRMSKSDCRSIARAALKAAMEAGGRQSGSF